VHPRLVLPPELRGRPFTVAEARARGLTEKQLRSAVVRAPFRGVRVPADLPDTLRTRCQAAVLVLPPCAVDASTALALSGLPVPRGSDPIRPLVVRVPSGTDLPHLRGVRPRSGPLQLPSAPRAGTLLAVTDVEAWAALGSDPRVPDDELVVVGDAIARRGRLPSLRRTAERYRGRRGGARLRRAVARVRERVDSPQETRLRLLVVAAGLPEFVPNLDVHAADGSGWICRSDLVLEEARTVLEYDGDVHAARARRRRDAARRELLDHHGWRVVVATADDLGVGRAHLVARIERALRDQGFPVRR
jgi:hypothetical protein